MKNTKRLISFILAAVLLFTSVPAAAFDPPSKAESSLENGYASSPDAYAIYPAPQRIEYGGGRWHRRYPSSSAATLTKLRAPFWTKSWKIMGGQPPRPLPPAQEARYCLASMAAATPRTPGVPKKALQQTRNCLTGRTLIFCAPGKERLLFWAKIPPLYFTGLPHCR